MLRLQPALDVDGQTRLRELHTRRAMLGAAAVQPVLDAEGQARLRELRRLLDLRLELSGVQPLASSGTAGAGVCGACGSCAVCAASAALLLGEGDSGSREKVVALLRDLDLAHYAPAIAKAGYTSSLDLCDADDAELTELAMTLEMKRPEERRFMKGVAARRARLAGQPEPELAPGIAPAPEPEPEAQPSATEAAAPETARAPEVAAEEPAAVESEPAEAAPELAAVETPAEPEPEFDAPVAEEAAPEPVEAAPEVAAVETPEPEPEPEILD